jgi:hypothetical protein
MNIRQCVRVANGPSRDQVAKYPLIYLCYFRRMDGEFIVVAVVLPGGCGLEQPCGSDARRRSFPD